MSKRIVYVDTDFRTYLDEIRKDFKKDCGITLTFPQITKIAAEKLRQQNFNGEIKEKMLGKKKRRVLEIEL